MSRRETWQQLYQRFDVYEYVTSARWRADRPLSPARKIIELLSTPFASDARILVTGTIGTGKTTELLRVAEARAHHEFVVFLDLARHGCGSHPDHAATRTDFLNGRSVSASASPHLSLVASARSWIM
jgi:hypothetical protein